MSRLYYDLHVHSCLSPCADDESTPNNLAAMAKLIGIDIVALTDHNSCENCPAFFEAAKRHGIIPIAGMELTTSEDIHMICLFAQLTDAMSFSEEVGRRLMPIKNRPEIFGEQLILDSEDKLVSKVQNLLSVATDISVEALPSLVEGYGGICYPAHIDRDSNGIIAILGTLPHQPIFSTVEMRDEKKTAEYTEMYALSGKHIIFNSDSHQLGVMNDREHFLDFFCERDDREGVARELIEKLR